MTNPGRACILAVVSLETPTRRDRKKEATRQALLDAALTLFAERGFAATTVEDIADAAGVAPRTFFRYFPNKAALLSAFDTTYRTLFRRSVQDTPAGQAPLTRLHHAVRATLRALHDQRDRLLMQHRILAEAGPEITEDQFATMWRAFETDVTESLEVPVEIARLLTGVAVGVAGAAIGRWIEADAAGDLGNLVDQSFSELTALIADATDPTD